MAWISPTGFVDPSNKWTGEERAYDGNVGVFTSTSKNEYYLELTRSAIQCDKIRIYAAAAKAFWLVADVTIDVYYSNNWHNIFSGTVPKLAWVEKAIGSTESVTAMRVKFHNIPGGGYGALCEAEFNEVVSGLINGYFMQNGVKVEKFGYYMNSIEEFGYYMNPIV